MRCDRLLVFAITMYPIINDRVKHYREYYCHFVPAENPNFVIALAFLGHHIPCIIIVVVYIIVFIEIRKLFKTRPGDKLATRPTAQANTVSSAAPASAMTVSTVAADPSPSTSRDPVHDDGITETALGGKTKNAAESDKNQKMDQQNKQPQQAEQQPKRQAAGASHAHSTSDAKARADRERKSFVTLSYIVIGYVVCWVPFHFVYDVSFIRPELVSEDLYTATFWITYVNSTLNPFLYAFSSADLRNAVIKMIRCRY